MARVAGSSPVSRSKYLGRNTGVFCCLESVTCDKFEKTSATSSENQTVPRLTTSSGTEFFRSGRSCVEAFNTLQRMVCLSFYSKRRTLHLSKVVNVILICAIMGAAFLTWFSPAVISALFTPPVSFGTNCEPAADWAMQKMVRSQLVGLVLGGLVGLVAMLWMKSKKKPHSHQSPSAP
jgi:hypothetical protein